MIRAFRNKSAFSNTFHTHTRNRFRITATSASGFLLKSRFLNKLFLKKRSETNSVKVSRLTWLSCRTFASWVLWVGSEESWASVEKGGERKKAENEHKWQVEILSMKSPWALWLTYIYMTYATLSSTVTRETQPRNLHVYELWQKLMEAVISTILLYQIWWS